jgi:hypothetical protein
LQRDIASLENLVVCHVPVPSVDGPATWPQMGQAGGPKCRGLSLQRLRL